MIKKPLLSGLTSLFLVPPSLVSAQSDDPRAAFERKDVAALTRMAEAGDPVAQDNLGLMFKDNSFYIRNADEDKYDLKVPLGERKGDFIAVIWFSKAAEQGYAPAQTNLGDMHLLGFGTPKDYAAAVSWFSKAAEQGYARAQMNLGRMYERGRGVPQDYAVAVSWYRKAVEQGYAPAQINLGFMYKEGYGVPQDYAVALNLYSKAAEWYRKALQQANDYGSKYWLTELYRIAERHVADLKGRIAEQSAKPKQYVYKDIYYKGYKILGRRDPVVNSCLDLIIQTYNISRKNKYGKFIVYRKLFYIQVNGPTQISRRNGAPFRVQNYTVGYVPNGENITTDIVYCESKNGIAFGLENSLAD